MEFYGRLTDLFQQTPHVETSVLLVRESFDDDELVSIKVEKSYNNKL